MSAARWKKLVLAAVLTAFLAWILWGTGALVLALSGSWLAAAGAVFACLALRLTLVPCLLTAWYLFAYAQSPFLAAFVCAPGFGRGLGDGPRGLPDLALKLWKEGLGIDRPPHTFSK